MIRYRRRRDHRLRLRRLADGAVPSQPRTARRDGRARASSAVRHRRVVHAAGEPAARRAGRPLRPAATSACFRSGARGSARVLMSPAGSSAASPSISIGPASRSPTIVITRANCSSPPARTTTSATRTGTGRTSTTTSRAKRNKPARSIWTTPNLTAIRTRRRSDDARRHAPRPAGAHSTRRS